MNHADKTLIIVMSGLSIAAQELSIVFLFNDSWSCFFVVIFVYFLQKDQIIHAFLAYSLAISIKFSPILFLPGFLFTVVLSYGFISGIFLLVSLVLC